jgi:hypothetical protein
MNLGAFFACIAENYHHENSIFRGMHPVFFLLPIYRTEVFYEQRGSMYLRAMKNRNLILQNEY